MSLHDQWNCTYSNMNLTYFGNLLKEWILAIMGTTTAEDNRFPVPSGPRWATVAPPGLLVGAVLHGFPGSSFHNADYRKIAESEFNSVTATAYFGWNAWDRNDPERFSGLQNVVDWARQHEFPVHAHVLLYPLSTRDRFTPDMADSEVVQRIRDYIEDFSSRFAGQIYVWDVANEVIGDDGDLMDELGLRTHWYGNADDPVRDYHAFGGSSFVEEAFQRARKNDPNAVLILNDYAAELKNKKSDRFLNYALYLRDEAKVPIDGVGFQMHWTETGFTPQVEQMRQNLQRFVDAGLRVFLTEVDVASTSSGNFPTNSEQQRQRTVFENIVQACLLVNGCEAVWLWDYADNLSWLGPETYATPFWDQAGGRGNAKPSYYGTQSALQSYAGSYVVQSWWEAETGYLGRNGRQDEPNGMWIPEDTVSLHPYTDPSFQHLRFILEPVGKPDKFRLRCRWGQLTGYLSQSSLQEIRLEIQKYDGSQDWTLEREIYPLSQLGYGDPKEQRVNVYRIRLGNLYLTRNGQEVATGVWRALHSVSLYDGKQPTWSSQLWTFERGG